MASQQSRSVTDESRTSISTPVLASHARFGEGVPHRIVVAFHRPSHPSRAGARFSVGLRSRPRTGERRASRRSCRLACDRMPRDLASSGRVSPLEIVNVNFESKCSIYVQHNLLTLFNCSPRLLLLLFRTFWNCSVLLLFTYRIVDRIGLAVTGSIGDRSEYCRRQSHKLDITHTPRHTHQVTNSVGQRQGSRVWTRRPSSSCQRKQCRRLRTAAQQWQTTRGSPYTAVPSAPNWGSAFGWLPTS